MAKKIFLCSCLIFAWNVFADEFFCVVKIKGPEKITVKKKLVFSDVCDENADKMLEEVEYYGRKVFFSCDKNFQISVFGLFHTLFSTTLYSLKPEFEKLPKGKFEDGDAKVTLTCAYTLKKTYLDIFRGKKI